MTLHEAIKQVLLDSKRSMTAMEIADEVNARELYSREDKKLVPPSQINARINNYPHLFTKLGGLIEIIERQKLNVEILLNNAIDLLRNNWAHGVGTRNSHLLIPLCFFFKRVIDNKELLDNSLNVEAVFRCDIDSFTRFLNLFVERHIDLKPGIQRINSELNSEGQTKYIEDLLLKLSKIDLSIATFSDERFSEFYLNLILKFSEKSYLLGQYSSPVSLSQLIAGLANLVPFKKVYNPATGIGTFPVYIKRLINGKEFYFLGEEINPDIYLLGVMNLIINGINTDKFALKDTLISRLEPDDFDLIICNPPFMANFDEHEWPRLPKSKKSHLQFLEYIISNLNSKRAIILMPENFFFSKSNIEVQIKRSILGNNLLEGIISLPPGIMLPYSLIKTSLLILNGNKKTGLSYFIDADNKLFNADPEKKTISIDTEKLLSLLNEVLTKNELITDVELVNEPSVKYSSQIIALQKVNQNETNLSVRRLLIQEPEGKFENPNRIQLREIMEIKSNRLVSSKAKYVNIRDLNSNFYDYMLKTELLTPQSKPGTLIENEAIFMGSIAHSYKPTFFDGSEPVLVSPNIYVLTLREKFKDKIDPEYLIYELASKTFTENLNSVAVGATTLTRISRNDLLNISIYLPDLKEQRLILDTKKEALYNAKITDAEILADNIGLTAKRDLDYLGFLEHELNNVAGGVNNYIIVLKSFLKTQNIEIDTKVSGRKNSSTVKEVFEYIERNMADIKNLLANISKIFDITNTRLNLIETNFKVYINEECSKQNDIINDFTILIGIDDNFNIEKDISIFVDQDLFSLVIRNFLVNSVKHGYDTEDKNKTIVFNLTQDEDFFYLNLINNGRPFPESFPPDSFAEFGKRGGTTQGSGLGGFIMAEIAGKHGGKLSVITDNEILQIYIDNQKLILKKGVHFQIQLPKNL